MNPYASLRIAYSVRRGPCWWILTFLSYSVQIVLDGYLADGSLLDEAGDVGESHHLYAPLLPPPPHL